MPTPAPGHAQGSPTISFPSSRRRRRATDVSVPESLEESQETVKQIEESEPSSVQEKSFSTEKVCKCKDGGAVLLTSLKKLLLRSANRIRSHRTQHYYTSHFNSGLSRGKLTGQMDELFQARPASTADSTRLVAFTVALRDFRAVDFHHSLGLNR